MKESSEMILEYTQGIDYDLYMSDQNQILRDAVERRFMIIGEALARLKRDDIVVYQKIEDAPAIRAFRNILVMLTT